MLYSRAPIHFIWLFSSTFDISKAAPAGTETNTQNLTSPGILVFQSYTAIGDSFASGVGAGGAAPQNTGYENCIRNVGSYAYQFSQAHNPNSFQFNACSGAQVPGIIGAQIDAEKSDFKSPDLVTISAGGNDDAAFYDVARYCVYAINPIDYKSCDDAIAKANNTFNGIQPVLEGLYTEALNHNPGPSFRTVAVLNYPVFYAAPSKSFCWTTDARMTQINYLSNNINDKMNKAVAAVNSKNPKNGNQVIYVDASAALEGHRFCDTGVAWLNGNYNPIPPNPTYSNTFFHPDLNGQKAYLGALETAVRNSING